MDAGWWVGGDWGYLALWSSTLLQIEHTVSSHQDEMRWKRFSTPPRSSEARPGLATFFTFILIKLSAKLAEIPDPGSGQVIPSLGTLGIPIP